MVQTIARTRVVSDALDLTPQALATNTLKDNRLVLAVVGVASVLFGELHWLAPFARVAVPASMKAEHVRSTRAFRVIRLGVSRALGPVFPAE